MTYRTATSCGSLTCERILEMRRAGTAAAEIAAAAGVSRATMYNALSEWGVVTQRGGDRRTRHWRETVAASIADVSRSERT